MLTTTLQYLEILSPCHCSITSYFHSADKYLQLVFGSCLQKYSRCKMSSISSLKTECLSVCHSHSLILVWKVSLSLLLCSNFSLSLALALSLSNSEDQDLPLGVTFSLLETDSSLLFYLVSYISPLILRQMIYLQSAKIIF